MCPLVVFPNSFLLFSLFNKYVLNLSEKLCTRLSPPPSPSHPLSVCPQASFKAWLGLDHYIKSIRHSTEDFEGMLKGMASSESSGGVMPGVKVSDITFAGVPVRVYEPPAGGEGHLRRGLIYFHGGGWALGTTSEYRH